MAETLIWIPSHTEGLEESETLRIMPRPMKWHGQDRQRAEVVDENGARKLYKEAASLVWNGIGCDRAYVPTMYYLVHGDRIVARAQPGRSWRAFLKTAKAWVAQP